MNEKVNAAGSGGTEISRTRFIAQVAMLGALGGVLMNLEIPVPFLAPSFYKFDFSEVPIMIGAFAMGPMAGVLSELVKILVHLVTKSTETAFVGDIANFIMGCAYLLPACLIYRAGQKKSRRRALTGMLCGILVTTVAAVFLNAFVLLPAYSKAFGVPIENFIQMGSAVHSAVNSLLTFALLIVAPFNLFKYLIVSAIVFLLYKHVRVILRGR